MQSLSLSLLLFVFLFVFVFLSAKFYWYVKDYNTAKASILCIHVVKKYMDLRQRWATLAFKVH